MSLRGGLNAADLHTAHLYEQVADLLEQEIVSGYKNGDHLPGELSLAHTFGVSRTVIREALKLLRERGLVDLRRGSSAVVSTPEALNLSAMVSRIILIKDIDYNDIYDVRIMLEVHCVRLAASRATPQELRQMRERLDLLQNRAISPPIRRDADYAFHLLIAKATGNQLLVLLVETMGQVFREMIKAGIFVSGGIDDAIRRHEKIYEALLAKDPARAEVAMREHLEQSRHHVALYRAAMDKVTYPLVSGAEDKGGNPT